MTKSKTQWKNEKRKHKRKLGSETGLKQPDSCGACVPGQDSKSTLDEWEQKEGGDGDQMEQNLVDSGEAEDLPPELHDVYLKFLQRATPQVITEQGDAVTDDNSSQTHAGSTLNASGHNDSEDESNEGSPSKKNVPKRHRLTMAQLKLRVSRPDLVETHDANAPDSEFLLYLKSYRSVVPVPQHWSYKRKFLSHRSQGSLLLGTYHLPSDIAATGVATIRKYYIERALARAIPGSQRIGTQRIDVPYDKFEECFFGKGNNRSGQSDDPFDAQRCSVGMDGEEGKSSGPPSPNDDACLGSAVDEDEEVNAMRPRLTTFGEIYFEGREHEIRCKSVRPGVLSARLRKALGMPHANYPPPWLVNMQAHGPPPAYPSLKVPGVNAPIPKGASWGFGRGQWCKPPTDAYGNGLFGDVYGLNRDGKKTSEGDVHQTGADAQTKWWGEYENKVEDDNDDEIGSLDPMHGTQPVEKTAGVQDLFGAAPPYSSPNAPPLPSTVTPQALPAVHSVNESCTQANSESTSGTHPSSNELVIMSQPATCTTSGAPSLSEPRPSNQFQRPQPKKTHVIAVGPRAPVVNNTKSGGSKQGTDALKRSVDTVQF